MTVTKQTQNQNKLRAILEDLTKKAGITERALARMLNIPPTTLYQLLNTDNPNPSVKTLLPIAKHFKLSIEQLMGEEPSVRIYSPLEAHPWQPELFIAAINIVNTVLEEKERKLDTKMALHIIREIYFYSLDNNIKHIDDNFAKWFINKSLEELAS